MLVIGASGGVGTFAVQLAAGLGATVTGVCRTGNIDLVTSLGAAEVVDYTRETSPAAGVAYDVVLDLVGNPDVGVTCAASWPEVAGGALEAGETPAKAPSSARLD